MSFRPETHEKRGDLLYLSPARREGARYWSRSDARLKGISLASHASDNSAGPEQRFEGFGRPFPLSRRGGRRGEQSVAATKLGRNGSAS